MTIFFVHGKPCIAVSNGYRPIPEQDYYMMLERSEIERVEVVDHD